ncbi:MAG: hypothetical protein BRD33_00120 [Bacteroidetes bacterium QH_6_63_17]|nr:MAG: hypothetical protein BRD33_00120 [Bacteroidetes bacterium QH_6_63_17]
MSKRALILCGTVSALLLTAAHAPTALVPRGDFLSRSTEPVHNELDSTAFERLSAAYAPASAHRNASVAPPTSVDAETLWLARAIYSETKRPHEQELIAWVVRNRVDTGYRGSTTYREAVLDPYQFSAFNPGSSKRSLLTSLKPDMPLPRWQQALWVARYVRHADPVYRPFSVETRHFYSERSMKGRPKPFWTRRHRFVSPGRNYQVDEHRFRFYEETSS